MTTNTDTTTGTVAGLSDGTVRAFKGIPFAAPATGALRFAPPEPVTPWAGVRDCTGYGAICPQDIDPASAILPGFEWNFYTPGAVQSEDCLNLNVWAPEGATDLRPVLFWIHGGAFLAGSGTALWCDGTNLARNENIVVVTVNYRLGILGTLDLTTHAPVLGNNMLRDQIAALRWVRDNIAAFGGDPGRVVIAGESAGAMSVAALLASPVARGLFHGAILQSGHGKSTASQELTARGLEAFLAAFGLSPASEADELAAKLRAAETSSLLAAQRQVTARYPVPFPPVVDGDVLPRAGNEAAAAGELAPVPLLIGTNTNENKLFSAMRWGSGAGDGDLRSRIAALFLDGEGDDATVDALTDQYRALAGNDKDAWDILATDRDWRGPARAMADGHAAAGAPVYQYEFNWATPVLGGALQACHGLDIPFTFGNLAQPGVTDFTGDDAGNAAARQLAEQAFNQAWGAFVRDGVPASSALPEWPRYTAADRAVMVIGAKPSVAYAPHGDRLDEWARLEPRTRPPLGF